MPLDPAAPPATPKQIEYLRALLLKAGYDSFKTARKTFGLTQRQASGKFTKKDASVLIDRLVNGESPDPVTSDPDFLHGQVTLVRGLHAQVLADELERRGWSVTPPPDQSEGAPKRPRSKSTNA